MTPTRRSFIPRALLVAVAMLLAAAATASAQQVGVRAGVSADPDQFYFGGHFESGPLVDRVHFRPSAEIGLGNDLTLVAFNFEFVYRFDLSHRDWYVYAGGGPAANVFRHSAGQGADGTSVEPGFNVLVGVASRAGLFTEFKLGFIDSPEVKFGVGYAWRW